MKEKIKSLLEEALPLVNIDSDFLFAELDSLGVASDHCCYGNNYGCCACGNIRRACKISR